MLTNKTLNPAVTELIIKSRKINISHIFITLSYFAVSKKCQTKFYTLFYQKKSKQIAYDHSSDIDFKYFMNLCKKCTPEPYYVLVIDTTLASDNTL